MPLTSFQKWGARSNYDPHLFRHCKLILNTLVVIEDPRYLSASLLASTAVAEKRPPISIPPSPTVSKLPVLRCIA